MNTSNESEASARLRESLDWQLSVICVELTQMIPRLKKLGYVQDFAFEQIDSVRISCSNLRKGLAKEQVDLCDATGSEWRLGVHRDYLPVRKWIQHSMNPETADDPVQADAIRAIQGAWATVDLLLAREARSSSPTSAPSQSIRRAAPVVESPSDFMTRQTQSVVNRNFQNQLDELNRRW